jgi:dihydroorotate dehydrogenase (fumarate)
MRAKRSTGRIGLRLWWQPETPARQGGRMVDLTTTYLTLRLRHPFIVGASPLADRLDRARRLEDGGASAVVIRSLFEEQITMARTGRIGHRDPAEPEFARLLGAFPSADQYAFGLEEYLEHIRRLKAALGVPVIASLNGLTTESWLTFARNIEQAGADALELNLYQLVADPARSSLAVESEIRDMVGTLKRTLRMPLAVKLPMFLTAPAHFARELDRAGANGLILFNRVYHPAIDIETSTLRPQLELSSSTELLARLAWLPILRGLVKTSLAVSGGVDLPADGIRAILAGADAVQMVSAIVRRGETHFSVMRDALAEWLQKKGCRSVGEARGTITSPAADAVELVERAHYLRTLQSGLSVPSPDVS